MKRNKKGKKMKVSFDPLDDNDRVQVVPNPEPKVDRQHEPWGFLDDVKDHAPEEK
jgi:hypothetical protein